MKFLGVLTTVGLLVILSGCGAALFGRSDDVDLKEVTEVKASASGIFGFRVWTLQGFDENGNLIAEESEDFGSLGNKDKLEAFIALLKEQGYMLTADQLDDLSSKLNISFLDALDAVKSAAPELQEVVDAILEVVAPDYVGVVDTVIDAVSGS